MHCGCSRILFRAQILSSQRSETVSIHCRSNGGSTMFAFNLRYNALPHVFGRSSLIFISLLLVGCGSGGSSSSPPPSVAATGTPGAEATVGERLFLETRFAQAFKVFLDNGGNINDPNAGDPVMNLSETTGQGIGLPGPFAGLSMNCRGCHFVDEHVGRVGGGMRTYTDFALRSPIPNRGDGKRTAPRNSPPLVNASLNRPGGHCFILTESSIQWKI